MNRKFHAGAGARPGRALRRQHWLAIALCLLCLPAAPGHALEVRDGRVRGLPPGQTTTAAFFVLHHDGVAEWVLTGAETPVAERVEIHRHLHREGVMSMRQVDQVVVPAGGRFEFAPGGYHLMLIGLRRALRDGETVPLTLHGRGGQSVTAELPVVSVLDEHRRNNN